MLKKGDIVETIDDNLIGTILSIEADGISIETEDGFVFTVTPSEVIAVETDDDLDKALFTSQDMASVMKNEDDDKTHNSRQAKRKEKEKAKFIVDLHSHEITDSTRGMSPHDILNLQLNTARHKLEFAIKKRIKKMVFIHGVGEGVLKQELHTILRRYDNVEFYDAEFKTFGLGATEVRIYQNLG